jgi:hypothetical protein
LRIQAFRCGYLEVVRTSLTDSRRLLGSILKL